MTPQAWRRTWLRVHRWIGLGLALLIVPLCLSGAALVWPRALDRLANPARYAVSGKATLPPSRYVAAAIGVLLPGERVASITWPDGRGPVVVAALPPGTRSGRPDWTNVYLDPPSARVLGRASGAGGLVRFLHVLHGSLQVPGAGRMIVGVVGIAMALSCLTGLWLWWPTVGRWTRGLLWRRHREMSGNLHHLAGFWMALPLLVLSVTGVLIAFPALTGGGHRRPTAAPPMTRPSLQVDAVVARAQVLAKGRVTRVTWPTTRSADWTVAFGPTRTVKVADDAGVAVVGRGPGAGGSLVRRIHDGTGFSAVWQTVIFMAGVAPALLAMTGVIMWRRARNRRGPGWEGEATARS